MRPRPTATAHDLGDLVNALPTMFGFPPHDSFVGLGMEGKRICFGMRLDLSDVDDVDDAADYVVRHLQEQVVGSGIDGAIVIALGEPLDLGRDLVLAVESRLFAGHSGDFLLTVDPVAGGWATDDRYWVSMTGGDPSGYPYRRSLDHPIAVQGMLAGREIVGSRVELEAKLEPIGGIRRRWLDAAADHIEQRLGAMEDDELSEAVLPVIHDLYASRPVGDAPALELAHAMTRIQVRDSAWDLITRENARDMVRVWQHVARLAPVDWAPPALSLLAFAAWFRGDGAFAVTAAQRALTIDPKYSMARLMLELATSGISPDAWERAPRRVRD